MSKEQILLTQINKPLVSICLLCYNQEKYIEQAVCSLLAQTYSPLEIIVSDDCSTDGTWEILKRLKKEYQGCHTFIIHRNERNLGIIRNLCTAFKLAHGELVVKADGDDISLPNRVEEIVRHWLHSDKEAWCLCSAYQKINLKGDIIGNTSVPFEGIDKRCIRDICWGNDFFYLGAASAYRRDVIEVFPWADYENASDDSVFTIRCAMLGKLYAFPDILVQYRIGSGKTTKRINYRETMANGISYCAISQQQLLLDLETVKQQLPLDVYEQFKESLTEFLRHNQEVLKLYNGKTFKERRLGLQEACGRLFSKYGLITHTLLLPPKIADTCFCIFEKLQSYLRH